MKRVKLLFLKLPNMNSYTHSRFKVFEWLIYCSYPDYLYKIPLKPLYFNYLKYDILYYEIIIINKYDVLIHLKLLKIFITIYSIFIYGLSR